MKISLGTDQTQLALSNSYYPRGQTNRNYLKFDKRTTCTELGSVLWCYLFYTHEKISYSFKSLHPYAMQAGDEYQMNKWSINQPLQFNNLTILAYKFTRLLRALKVTLVHFSMRIQFEILDLGFVSLGLKRTCVKSYKHCCRVEDRMELCLTHISVVLTVCMRELLRLYLKGGKKWSPMQPVSFFNTWAQKKL